MERWKKIEEFPRYSISSDGNVRRDATKRIMQPNRDRGGYMSVKLRTESVVRRVSIHRIVAIAWVVNPDGKPHVNHLNGIKDDNRAVNLEWVTHRENIAHATRSGLRPVGENHRFAKLTSDDVRFIRSSVLRDCELARMFDVARNTIYYARIGKNWAYLETRQ